MTFAFLLFLLSLVFVPISFAVDGPIVHGLFTAWTALVVMTAAWSLPPAEAGHVRQLLRPFVIAAAVPAALMLLQILPNPISSWNHPVWVAAADALGRPIFGSISLSPGDTLLALTRYVTAMALLFTAAALTVDRSRAETVLATFTAVSTLAALVLIVHDAGGFYFLGEVTSTEPRATIHALSGFGLILSATGIIQSIERYETRRSRSEHRIARSTFVLTAAVWAIAFALCALALALFSPGSARFAAVCGLATLLAVTAVRRLGLETRSSFVLIAVVLALPLAFVAHRLLVGSGDLTLRFVAHSPQPFLAMVGRMIGDTGWLGAGAGSFAALLPVYQGADAALPVMTVAPSAAAEILIGLGRPALFLILLGAGAAAIYLLRGALGRGRDSFFPAAAAGVLLAALVAGFADPGLFATSTIVVIAGILGFGLAQSVGRTAR